MNTFTLIEIARSLRTEDDNNPEYDRALVELVHRSSPFEVDITFITELILGDRSENHG